MQKTSNGTTASKTTATTKRAAAKAGRATKTARSASKTAAKTSTEIKPRRTGSTLSDTANTLKSPKVLVPLLVAVGVGIAAVRKAVTSSGNTGKTLPRLAKEVSPRFSEAVSALAELGRELRAKIR